MKIGHISNLQLPGPIQATDPVRILYVHYMYAQPRHKRTGHSPCPPETPGLTGIHGSFISFMEKSGSDDTA